MESLAADSPVGDNTDALEVLIRHVLEFPAASLPDSTRDATRRFLLDSMGVGVNGSSDPDAGRLLDMFAAEEGAPAAGVFGTSVRLPAADAAFMNAFQIHNAEYDCVHEGAVVHPMAVILGAVSATVEVMERAGEQVPGSELEAAIALGVDVAAGLGIASHAPLKFFRPATAGCFGATLAIARLRKLSVADARAAVGIAHGQLCGTMQAHIEGSPLLAMQIGFNARNAVRSVAMAIAGIQAPADVLEGPFGYFALFEGEYDLAPVLASLGKSFRIEEVAHKPFPSGRATHGIIDACLSLREKLGIGAKDVSTVRAQVPPLTWRLIGRPVADDMNANYARLCGQYVTAVVLESGDLQPEDFGLDKLRCERRLQAARQVEIVADDNPDPNALTPIRVTLDLLSGESHTVSLDTIYGNPQKPMRKAAYLRKFERNLHRARVPYPAPDEVAQQVIGMIDVLDSVPSSAELLKCLHSPS